MRRMVVIGFLALAAAAPALARDLQDSLEARWRGAWVLSTVDTRADCAGTHTNNRVNGALVQSQGRFRFRPGELAQVQKIDLKRSRLDLFLRVPEPLLVSYQDGSFTLYNEVRCLVQLEVELPRSLVSGNDVQGIDAALGPVLKRFNSQEEATQTRAWNRRHRDPYPEDYDRTLAAHAAWKAERANAAIQARLEQAAEETSRIADRLSSDPDYLKGFAAGIEATRAIDLSQCGDILARDFNNIAPKPPQLPAGRGGEADARANRGYQDGARLVFGLESLRRLPQCFVPVPEVPDKPAPPAPSQR